MTSKNQITVTITNGTSVSNTIALPPACRIAAIAIPAGWTAADIGFNVGNTVDGSGNLTGGLPLYQSGGAIYSVKAAASKVTLLGGTAGVSAYDLMTFPYLQITSLSVGTANAANQVSTVVLTVYFDDLS